MLTRDEIATMRRNAIDSQYREVRRWSVVTFQGGPLDGLRIRVLPNEAASHRVGFCIVTRTGPVQALYAPGPDSVCRFASLERVA